MMIMGGGLVSWLQGYVADITSIHTSYIVGVLCFVIEPNLQFVCSLDA